MTAPKMFDQNELSFVAREVVGAGGLRSAWRHHKERTGRSFGWWQSRYAEAVRRNMAPPLQRGGVPREQAKVPAVEGRVQAPQLAAQPVGDRVRRYILTAAQSNTHLHEPLWENLKALAAHYDARIMVGTLTYDHRAFGQQSVKRGTYSAPSSDTPWWDPRVEDYVVDERVELAPGLVWCGETNIIPSAVRPLSGWESYTGRRSSIFPHTKIAMESVASGKREGTKLVYTTGAVTQRNYIQKKAGQRAEFHHAYGALLVEVDRDGDWFCRQLNADSEGVVHDLNLRVGNGVVTEVQSIEAITWGDIHVARLDPSMRELCWGRDGIFYTLRPKYQFMHDVLDFRARNGHTFKRRLIHDRFREYTRGWDSVEKEVKRTALFIRHASPNDTHGTTVVVPSNHDEFMEEWLRIGDYRDDPINAVYFLRAQLYMYKTIADGRQPNLTRWAVYDQLERMRIAGNIRRDILFPERDESFIVCPDANGGIECADHGDLGPNGVRGTANAYAKMGRKHNIGHSHVARIVDGVYQAGVMASLDHDYNRGPSSWSQSLIATYPNGKRTIITVWNWKWRAQ